MQIRIRVTPNAKKSEILGWEDDPQSGRHLRVRIQAPPVDGKANKALLAFLAKELGLPRSRLAIARGESSRLKTIDLPDDTRLPE